MEVESSSPEDLTFGFDDCQSEASETEGGSTAPRKVLRVSRPVDQQIDKVRTELSCSIGAATQILEEKLLDISQALQNDLLGQSQEVVRLINQLGLDIQKDARRWQARHKDRVTSEKDVDSLIQALDKAREKQARSVDAICRDNSISLDMRMKAMIASVAESFDAYLEDAQAQAKKVIRWMKRKGADELKMSRSATRLELQETILLDRCLLDEMRQDLKIRAKTQICELEEQHAMQLAALQKQVADLERSNEVSLLLKSRVDGELAAAKDQIKTLKHLLSSQSPNPQTVGLTDGGFDTDSCSWYTVGSAAEGGPFSPLSQEKDDSDIVENAEAECFSCTSGIDRMPLSTTAVASVTTSSLEGRSANVESSASASTRTKAKDRRRPSQLQRRADHKEKTKELLEQQLAYDVGKVAYREGIIVRVFRHLQKGKVKNLKAQLDHECALRTRTERRLKVIQDVIPGLQEELRRAKAKGVASPRAQRQFLPIEAGFQANEEVPAMGERNESSNEEIVLGVKSSKPVEPMLSERERNASDALQILAQQEEVEKNLKSQVDAARLECKTLREAHKRLQESLIKEEKRSAAYKSKADSLREQTIKAQAELLHATTQLRDLLQVDGTDAASHPQPSPAGGMRRPDTATAGGAKRETLSPPPGSQTVPPSASHKPISTSSAGQPKSNYFSSGTNSEPRSRAADMRRSKSGAPPLCSVAAHNGATAGLKITDDAENARVDEAEKAKKFYAQEVARLCLVVQEKDRLLSELALATRNHREECTQLREANERMRHQLNLRLLHQEGLLPMGDTQKWATSNLSSLGRPQTATSIFQRTLQSAASHSMILQSTAQSGPEAAGEDDEEYVVRRVRQQSKKALLRPDIRRMQEAASRYTKRLPLAVHHTAPVVSSVEGREIGEGGRGGALW